MTKRVSVGIGGSLGPPAAAVAGRSRSLEDRGFDLIAWPDHLMGWLPESLWTADISSLASVSPSRSPHVFLDVVACMAAAATSTERALLATCVTDPLRRHPAMLANEFLTLHHMSEGRAVLGLGAGEGENTVPYGIDYRYQTSKLEEALRVIRALWASGGEPVDLPGRFFPLQGAVLGLEGFEGTFPPIWLGAHGPRMCALAGELADGWLPVNMPIDDYRQRLTWIRDSARAHGRDPASLTTTIRSYVVMGEDHERVHALLEHPLIKALCLSLPDWLYGSVGGQHPLGEGFHGLRSYIPSGLSREDALELIDRVPFQLVHDYMWHGSPDDFVRKARPYVEEGASHVILFNMGHLADPGGSLEAFRLLRDVVVEFDRAFNGQAAERVAT
jgi:phthiodiolone/phenolphthiodiolone dimycocerosates ketoreductase